MEANPVIKQIKSVKKPIYILVKIFRFEMLTALVARLYEVGNRDRASKLD